jgi:hypothetical protein
MYIFVSPEGNPEVWNAKPEGYFTVDEWHDRFLANNTTSEAPESAETFCLNSSGTYHRLTCSHASQAGTTGTLEEIVALMPAARPCGVCQPPVLEPETA